MDGWQRNFDASPDAGNEPRGSAFAAAPIKVVISSETFVILALISGGVNRRSPTASTPVCGGLDVGDDDAIVAGFYRPKYLRMAILDIHADRSLRDEGLMSGREEVRAFAVLCRGKLTRDLEIPALRSDSTSETE